MHSLLSQHPPTHLGLGLTKRVGAGGAVIRVIHSTRTWHRERGGYCETRLFLPGWKVTPAHVLSLPSLAALLFSLPNASVGEETR